MKIVAIVAYLNLSILQSQQKPKSNPLIKPIITKWLFAISVMWQVLNLAVLTIIEAIGDKDTTKSEKTGKVVCDLFHQDYKH